jgi:hypothetical protein
LLSLYYLLSPPEDSAKAASILKKEEPDNKCNSRQNKGGTHH